MDHKIDVLLGGGRYEQKITGGPFAGGTVVDQAKKQASSTSPTRPD